MDLIHGIFPPFRRYYGHPYRPWINVEIFNRPLTYAKEYGIVLATKETDDKEITSITRSQRVGDGEIPAEMRLGKWTLEGLVKGGCESAK